MVRYRGRVILFFAAIFIFDCGKTKIEKKVEKKADEAIRKVYDGKAKIGQYNEDLEKAVKEGNEKIEDALDYLEKQMPEKKRR